MRISDFSIVDHGIENSQYFQGCGVAFTSYSHVTTGIGANFAEAIEDAIEQIASGGTADDTDWTDLSKRILKQIGRRTLPKRPQVRASDNEDTYYHVSIRYNVESVPPTAAQLAERPDPVPTVPEVDPDDTVEHPERFDDMA